MYVLRFGFNTLATSVTAYLVQDSGVTGPLANLISSFHEGIWWAYTIGLDDQYEGWVSFRDQNDETILLVAISPQEYENADIPTSRTTSALLAGAGSEEWVFEARDQTDQPIKNVKVWVTGNRNGSNVIAGTLYTDEFGKATFMLNPGTYYAWRQHSTFTFQNPLRFTVPS